MAFFQPFQIIFPYNDCLFGVSVNVILLTGNCASGGIERSQIFQVLSLQFQKLPLLVNVLSENPVNTSYTTLMINAIEADQHREIELLLNGTRSVSSFSTPVSSEDRYYYSGSTKPNRLAQRQQCNPSLKNIYGQSKVLYTRNIKRYQMINSAVQTAPAVGAGHKKLRLEIGSNGSEIEGAVGKENLESAAMADAERNTWPFRLPCYLFRRPSVGHFAQQPCQDYPKRLEKRTKIIPL